MASWQRSHHCGAARRDHLGQVITLNGWVHNRRDHGGLIFVDIRDRDGITQVVFDPAHCGNEGIEKAKTLRNEFVIAVTGPIRARLAGKTNPKLATGEVELEAHELVILNRCDALPMEVNGEGDLASEEVRLRYRYLDLRRPPMQQVMFLRAKLNRVIREFLDSQGFIEVETPILGRSTPEGARDYLVPSRVHHTNWYALPQSPQLYKQVLMVAGYEKYYQIARCFRDEDLRANRQPEFTQLDIELAFIDRDEVMGLVEQLATKIFADVVGISIPTPFPRLTYAEAMERFGSDKPDLRFGMELVDVTTLVRPSEFQVFQNAPCIRGLNVVGAAEAYSRKALDELTDYAKDFGAKGLVWMKAEGDKINAPTAKFLSAEQQANLRQAMNAGPGDLLLFVADEKDATHAPLNALRNRLARERNLFDPTTVHVSWCIDFPMFEKDEESGNWVAKHHPFTTLLDSDWPLLETNPGAVRAKAYDLIINGEESAGGTIRIHDQSQQQRIFGFLGLSEAEAKKRFGFLLDALRYGAPPHGGIAFGLDRWVMILANKDNIRDCIAFPKTQRATDLMTGAPSAVESKQLRELGVTNASTKGDAAPPPTVT